MAAASDVVVRRFRADDRPSLDALVAEGKAVDGFAGSSDPDGGAFGFFAHLTPGELAVAVRGASLVGVISPEIKAVYVTPAERRHGLGRRLVDEAEHIERERDRPLVFLGTLPDDDAALGFLRSTGFAYHSTLWDMRLPEDTAVAAPDWPEGLVARAIRLPDDVPAFVDLFNTAFAEHATPLRMDLAMWDRDELLHVEPQDVRVIEDPADAQRLIAFCSTDPGRRPADHPRPRSGRRRPARASRTRPRPGAAALGCRLSARDPRPPADPVGQRSQRGRPSPVRARGLRARGNA